MTEAIDNQGYWKRLRSGQHGLAKSFWWHSVTLPWIVFSILLGGPVIGFAYWINTPSNHEIVFLGTVAILLALQLLQYTYTINGLIGVWNASNFPEVSNRKAWTARLGVFIVGGYFVVFPIVFIVSSALPDGAYKDLSADEISVVSISRVIDGDTVWLNTTSGERIKVRLIYIDAPELDQSLGTTAKSYLESMVYGASVLVLEEFGTDEYGRTLGILSADKKDLNLSMVSAGLAWVYRPIGNAPKRYDKAEESAQINKLGVWQLPMRIPPWDWREN